MVLRRWPKYGCGRLRAAGSPFSVVRPEVPPSKKPGACTPVVQAVVTDALAKQ
jgi:hypothetical protein